MVVKLQQNTSARCKKQKADSTLLQRRCGIHLVIRMLSDAHELLEDSYLIPCLIPDRVQLQGASVPHFVLMLCTHL
jgi:hypothetical protein